MLCPLCKLEKVTYWYFENDTLVVLDCKTCHLPQVVLKRHTMEPTIEEKQEMIEKLTKIANSLYGKNNWRVREYQRKIKNHIHFHAIPVSFEENNI